MTRAILALLAVLLLPIAGARADTVRLLTNARDAFRSRADAVAAAHDEILAQAFIWGDDDVTLATLSLLRDAARRGACVKILVDAQWSRIPGPVQQHLKREGVQIREYHPFRLDRLHWTTRRMHEKLLIVDGRLTFAGGRNVESPYFGQGDDVDRRDYVDCDVLVEGALAADARDHFLAVWESAHVRPARHPSFPEDVAAASRRLDRAAVWLQEHLDDTRPEAEAERHAPTEVASIGFLHDCVETKGLQRGTAHALRDLLREAKDSVIVETPYLVPSRALRRELKAARERGVRIRVLTNSLASTDNTWPQAALAGDRKDIVAWGVELWEYQGPESLHSKTAVIDGRTAIVGSFNLHPRSEDLDTEVAVVAGSEELSAQLLATMDSHLRRALRIGPDGRPEGCEQRYPGVSGAKIARMRAARLLVPLFRRQL